MLVASVTTAIILNAVATYQWVRVNLESLLLKLLSSNERKMIKGALFNREENRILSRRGKGSSESDYTVRRHGILG